MTLCLECFINYSMGQCPDKEEQSHGTAETENEMQAVEKARICQVQNSREVRHKMSSGNLWKAPFGSWPNIILGIRPHSTAQEARTWRAVSRIDIPGLTSTGR